jgi:hypothetical protein
MVLGPRPDEPDVPGRGRRQRDPYRAVVGRGVEILLGDDEIRIPDAEHRLHESGRVHGSDRPVGDVAGLDEIGASVRMEHAQHLRGVKRHRAVDQLADTGFEQEARRFADAGEAALPVHDRSWRVDCSRRAVRRAHGLAGGEPRVERKHDGQEPTARHAASLKGPADV